MPTTAEPSKQAPMQAVVDLASQKTLDNGPVVTRQPTLEPRPEAEPVLGLRGGGISDCGCKGDTVILADQWPSCLRSGKQSHSVWRSI
ncbi:hypothetical protein HYQ46_001905 [Verticillium longisporum]|nr:hypothetical protein HYQ46_001905 [Verticillium longisporum]